MSIESDDYIPFEGSGPPGFRVKTPEEAARARAAIDSFRARQALREDVSHLTFFIPKKTFHLTRAELQARQDDEPTNIEFDPPYFVEAGKRYALRFLEGRQRVFEVKGQESSGAWIWGDEAMRGA